MDLIFASHNEHKLIEISKVLPSEITISNLQNSSIKDIPETGKTLTENALIKARFVYEKTGKNCFADDTGLVVEALNGEPGVYSARYAGEPKNDQNNVNKLLENLKGIQNRKASFKTVIALILESKEYLFEGEVQGEIITEFRGENGFGYDPIFQPLGYDKTFAELTLDEKKFISHRSIAVGKMIDFLSNYNH